MHLRLLDGLAAAESPSDPALRSALQAQLALFQPAEWDALAAAWPQRATDTIVQLAQVLSPLRQGAPAHAILRAVALAGPLPARVAAVQRLRACESLDEGTRAELLAAVGAGEAESLLPLLELPQSGPRHAEAAEAACDNQPALAAAQRAGCYYCMATFAAETVTEWTDGGSTALCPCCGTDAVLPDTAGFDLSPLGLQALREYWFG